MSHYELPYGHTKKKVSLAQHLSVTWLLPNEVDGASDPDALVAQALGAPLGNVRLEDFRKAKSVAIAVNDKTRPIPHALLLRPLLQRLESLGIVSKTITLITAMGTHIPMQQHEFAELLPADIVERYTVISHDCDAEDMVHLGTTERGTPVIMNRTFVEADLRIVVGNVEPHHFAGFSGGVKSAAIGLSSRETITANHSHLLDERAALARYDDNPLRQDIEDIGKLADVHFALNLVMNRYKKPVQVFAGEPRAVIQAAMPVVRSIYQVPVAEPFDVMLTCPGGYPKDINLYQAHKAVSCANRITKPGGEIILVAACEDGVGSAGYADFMARGHASHQAVMDAFVKEPFRIGAHKAYIFARDAVRVKRITIVSEIDAAQVKGLLLHPATLEQAVADSLASLPPGARVGIMPYANATIPILENA